MFQNIEGTASLSALTQPKLTLTQPKSALTCTLLACKPPPLSLGCPYGCLF